MDRIITIEHSDIKTGKLTLSDEGTTNAIPGDQVTWVIGAKSGVAAIVNIKNKPKSIDVFKPDPKLQTGKTSWEGTVNPDIITKTDEQYSITWNATTGGWHGQGSGPYVFDPTIRVNPKGTK